MDIGILLPFRNPAQWHAPITKIYDEHIEEAVFAEEAASRDAGAEGASVDAALRKRGHAALQVSRITQQFRARIDELARSRHRSNPTNRNNSVEKSNEYIYRPANRSRCPTERQTQADGLPAREGPRCLRRVPIRFCSRCSISPSILTCVDVWMTESPTPNRYKLAM